MDEKVKKAALENLERLVARIKELEKKLANSQNSRCWWDGESCQKYSEIRGLQYCGIVCSQCSRLDEETLWTVLDQACIFRGSSLLPEDAVTEGKEDGIEETWQEIHENILDVMADVGVESVGPADLAD